MENNRLELAKKALESGLYDRKTIEYLFPELEEGKDEKIRKGLIESFQYFCGDFFETSRWGKDNNLFVKDIIAWLEKQGEQKPAWSEEDERLRKTTISFLKNFADNGYENAVECIDWLKEQGK